MNIKIKEIELEAFRAYKDKQVFDFTNKRGSIANLVVIFAPNGFGKTSLLDAVEWGLNKEINRFSNNEVLKKTTKLEKGIILKNRDSLNSYGVVKFTDNKNQILLLNTKVKGRIYSTDYNEGIEIENSSNLKNVREHSLARDNILSHDKIDSFLLFSSGKDRYEALAKFWDYSNDTENYKSIYLLWNEVKKEIADKNKILKNLAKQIKEMSLPIEDLNLHIDKINDFKIPRMKLKKIMDRPSQKDLEQIAKESVNWKSNIITELRELQNNILNVEQLFETLPQYNRMSILYMESKAKIERLQKQINQHTLKVKLLKKEKLINEQKSKITKELEMLSNIKEKRNFFLQANKDVSINENKIAQNNKKITELKKVNYEILSKNLKIESNNEQEKKLYNNLILENKIITQEEELYKSLIPKQSKVQSRLIRVKKIINKRLDNLETFRRNIIELEHLLGLNFNAIVDYDFSNSRYTKDIPFLQEIDYSLNLLKEKRKKKQQEYIRYGKLNEELNKIIKVGRQIIESSTSSECPLCSTPFSNFEELINRVDRNIDDTFQLDVIHQEIKILDSKIKEKESTREDLFLSLKKNIEMELRKLEEANKNERQKIDRIKLINEKESTLQLEIDLKIKELVSHFKKYNTEFIEENFDEGVQVIKRKLLKTINKQEDLLLENDKKITALNKKLNKNKNSILKYEKENIGFEEIIKNINLDPNYQIISNLLNTLEISLDVEAIIEREINENKKLNDLNNESKHIQVEINNNIKDLGTEDYYTLEKLLINSKDENKKYKEFLENYSTRYENFLKTREIKEGILQEAINKDRQSIENKQRLVSYLDLLKGKVQYINEEIEASSKIKERDSITTQLKNLIEIQSKLNEPLKYSQNLIIRKIEKAFNLEVINKIYSRIEPHPELKLMEIVPSFIGDKPSLEIYAPMNKERKDNPVLFFSSAQLDILSLSIFFAKALMEPNPLLNTIFMDDPVHHMDSINVLSFIDILRTLTSDFDRQIIITTHNENLFKLMEQKIDPDYCNSKFIQLDSHGKVLNN
ncbi:AAA family ATPase [Priestia megaterium]